MHHHEQMRSSELLGLEHQCQKELSNLVGLDRHQSKLLKLFGLERQCQKQPTTRLGIDAEVRLPLLALGWLEPPSRRGRPRGQPVALLVVERRVG